MDALSSRFAFPPLRTVLKDADSSFAFDWQSDVGVPLVSSPAQRIATTSQWSVIDLSTTIQSYSTPTGAKRLQMVFSDIGTTAVNQQFLKVVCSTVLDPLTASEAAARLGSAGAHWAWPFGLPLEVAFPDDNRLLQVYYVTNVAVGAGHTLLSIIVGF